MNFARIRKIFSILSRPFLTMQVTDNFFKIRSDLTLLPLKDVIKKTQEKNPSPISERDLNFADWLLRIFSRKLQSPSPCLCHALSLFSMCPKEALLLLYAKKEIVTLDGHAAVQFRGQIFSTATGWHTTEPFIEIRKIQRAT